jgi:outer membrane immunogenic protein
MRRILLSASALALLAGSAYAADLPSRMAPPMVPAPVPVFTWTGFYLGVNGGYAGDQYRYSGSYSEPGLPDGDGVGIADPDGLSANAHITSSGFVGGGQIGYNYQFGGPFVLGIEADIQASGLKGELGIGANAGGGGLSASAGSKTEYFGTVRGRLGYAVLDRMLAYVTGGFAWGNTKSYYNITGFGGGLTGSTSSDRGGWTLGGGVEYAVLPNWTIKAEYLYVDLGNSTLYNGNLGGAIDGNINLTEKTRFNVVRAGVNYRF